MGEILDTVTGALGSVGDWIADGIGGILSSFFYGIFYSIGTGLCWIVGILDQLFSVMSGMTKVRYQGKPHTLIDVFFGNTVVENIYWAMALIGILLCFVFAILAVAKKAVDSGDKMRQSMGGILTGMFKGILIIICMTFILNVVLSFSDKLLTQINYAFNYADTLDKEDSIEFKDDQYAAMARVLDTIANYSLNPSYNSRYNLNSCFNEIRGDLQYLEQQGVFDFYYVTDGGTNESWQSALQKIVNSADLNRDLSLDIYNTQVSDALLACMKTMQTNNSFAPLKSYTRQYRAVLPQAHPLAAQDAVTLEQLASEPFLVIEEGSLSRPLEAFREAGLAPRVRLRVHDDYSILSMVEHGLGVSILPELVLRKTNYQIAIRPLQPVVTRKLGFIAKSKNELPLASKYFINFMVAHIEELP